MYTLPSEGIGWLPGSEGQSFGVPCVLSDQTDLLFTLTLATNILTLSAHGVYM